MRVTLLAWTNVSPDSYTKMTQAREATTSADQLAEFAGRACYESWDRPNPKTAANGDYLRNIIAQAHFSVLEHASATFYVENVTRSLTHELVRHRHLSFSQRSQRYVDESNAGWHYPDAVQAITDDSVRHAVENSIDEVHEKAALTYEAIVDRLLLIDGITRKQARQAARTVLPNGTFTSIVVTGNHRAWREMIAKRWHVAADSEIRELAGVILNRLHSVAPNTYQDFNLNRPIGMPQTGE